MLFLLTLRDLFDRWIVLKDVFLLYSIVAKKIRCQILLFAVLNVTWELFT